MARRSRTDPHDPPEAAAVAGGRTVSAQLVEARHREGRHRLLLPIEHKAQLGECRVRVEAGAGDEQRRPRADRQRGRQRRVQAQLQAADATGCTLWRVARAVVVIPNWNGAHFLSQCLESLAAQSLSAEVVVVDGASSDGSQELVRSRFPAVELLALERNRGFAGAANAGLQHALARGADYVALLNNDAVAAPDWLERLVAAADEHPEAGTVASKLLRSDGERIDSTGDFYSSWGWAYPRGRDELDARPVRRVAGGVLRLRRSQPVPGVDAARGRPVRRGVLRLSRGPGPRLPRSADGLEGALRAERGRLPPHDGHERHDRETSTATTPCATASTCTSRTCRRRCT